MLRTFVCAAVALFVVASLAVAADVKKAKPTNGKIKSIDVEKKTMTVTTGKKDAPEDKEYKISDTVKVTVMLSETEKKELVATEGLKAEQMKAGARVSLTVEDGKVTAITVRAGKKKDK